MAGSDCTVMPNKERFTSKTRTSRKLIKVDIPDQDRPQPVLCSWKPSLSQKQIDQIDYLPSGTKSTKTRHFRDLWARRKPTANCDTANLWQDAYWGPLHASASAQNKRKRCCDAINAVHNTEGPTKRADPKRHASRHGKLGCGP